MLEKVSVKAEEFIHTQPDREVGAIETYIKQGKLLRSDLKAVVNSAQARMGSADYLKAASYIEEIEMRLPVAEAVLEHVRNERPVEISEFDDFGEMNVQASVNELAHYSALSTMGLSPMERYQRANAEFRDKIASELPDNLTDFPRQMFNEKLAELIRLSDRELVAAVKKEFPTNEWIGAEPEGAEERMHSVFEDESNHPPETRDLDSEFDSLLDKERSHRGIQKSETQFKASAKLAYNNKFLTDYAKYLRDEYGYSEEQIQQTLQRLVDEAVAEQDHSDYDPEYKDYDPNPHGQGAMSDSWIDPESGEQRLGKKASDDDSDSDDSDEKDKNSGDKDKLPNDKMKEKAKETEEKSDDDKDDKSDNLPPWLKKKDDKEASATRSNSKGEPATSGEGATVPDTTPKAEEAFEKEVEKEQNKGQKAPVGPNRRRNSDVPAYSTSPSKLTSSLVRKVQGSLNKEGFDVDYETSHKILEMYLSEK